MRDPKRIDIIMNHLTKVWKANPDWRLGQLVANMDREYEQHLFWLEDDAISAAINAATKEDPCAE